MADNLVHPDLDNQANDTDTSKTTDKLIDVEASLRSKYPPFNRWPTLLQDVSARYLRYLIHEDEINEFTAKGRELDGFEFIESVLEHFNFSYKVNAKEIENIPSIGGTVVVANHPLGALDALALLNLISRVRTDIKIIANDMLAQFEPLRPLLISVDNIDSRSSSKKTIELANQALAREELIIMFPSGEVSRAHPSGQAVDRYWKKGCLRFAKNMHKPILPIHIKAKNSWLFYATSILYRPLSMLLLPSEMFKQRDKTIEFTIGEQIHPSTFIKSQLSDVTLIKLLRKHLYRLNKPKKALIFETMKCIAHPENKAKLKEEISQAQHLGNTTDGKAIYLFTAFSGSKVMKEIGRLREYIFRKAEEGSGNKRDLDEYDKYYDHLVLWDDEKLDIVGAYRVGLGSKILQERGMDGFYGHTLFEYQSEFEHYLSQSVELGRSFVQPKYWGSRALDYLWQGIGAYVRVHPEVRYLFGAVSMSDSYPDLAKSMIIYYYNHYYSRSADKSKLVKARNPYQVNEPIMDEFLRQFDGSDIKADYNLLSNHLELLNQTVPTLYKQYSNVVDEGGIEFLSYNVDPDFADCIDSLILVDIHKFAEKKRKRYLGY